MKHDLAKLKHVVMDMDGTIYHGKNLFPTTLPFLERLRSLGIGYTFLTNNSSRSVSEYLAHLEQFGISIRREQMYTSTLNASDYLKRELPELKSFFMIGTPAFRQEMEGLGFHDASMEEEPEGVVTAFDTALPYERLCRAAWWIKHGKPWIATHPDLECPTDRETTLIDCGSVTACLEKVSGRTPVVLGKPNPEMLYDIMRRNGVSREETAMCGDRLYTDLRLAANAGVTGVLISSAALETIEGNFADITVRHLEEFGEMISAARMAR